MTPRFTERTASAITLHDIFQAIVVSRIQYSSPAWSGMCLAADLARLDSLLRRGKRLRYCADEMPTVADLFDTADDDFFHRVKTNSHHVLQPYLPHQADITYPTSCATDHLPIRQNSLIMHVSFVLSLSTPTNRLPFDCITLYCHISCPIVCLSCCMVACDNLN